ncbi:Crp/Fnr family transcriptional regulator [Marixanthomonas spongiae]|uniref:Crp/Fnr family transcriptional regulator n=1 Tax=Marixanthomonas spongiae TaxID=2174845 RepID=A0A2U0HYI0_9FLAO|nr:Crp/Fnr family transcriptional regulator [Marixanthomonas spongiae]PVW13886.1 Crp/Fnr family transcriptional regulator [Marixanthomonas spongiae]
MIDEKILFEHQAELVDYASGDMIFSENQRALFYYQVKKGEVKMFNLNEDGKEFVQGMFEDGESFGEPPLFGDFKYPASAVAINDSQIIKLNKTAFFSLLKEHFDIHLQMTATLSRRLSYKAMMMKEISVYPPEHRVLTVIDFLKQKDGNPPEYEVELTRQQIADLTGLRVETVIRAVKQLEEAGKIKIINRKIHR